MQLIVAVTDLGSCLLSSELFDERFINHLFTLVERTRLLDDETLNYALIKLIVRTIASLVVAPAS
jgi:hypothetical protein